jgi:hypothetical protein
MYIYIVNRFYKPTNVTPGAHPLGPVNSEALHRACEVGGGPRGWLRGGGPHGSAAGAHGDATGWHHDASSNGAWHLRWGPGSEV